MSFYGFSNITWKRLRKIEGWGLGETSVLVMYLPGKHRSYAWPFPPAGKDRGTAASYPGTGEAGLSGSRWFAHQPVKLQVQWETLSHNISWGRVSEDHKNSDLGYLCACARVCVHTLAHTHMDSTLTKETNGRNEPSGLERLTLNVVMFSTCVTKFLNYFYILKGVHKPGMWWYTPEIQILERMRQENLRAIWATQQYLCACLKYYTL